MKKLLLFAGTMFLLVSCVKEETNAGRQPDRAVEAPPIYGMAMLKDAPRTRGVANKLKVWNQMMVEDELTVRFLNGPAEYQSFVKDVAHEWEKVADVKFHFLQDTTLEAMIRIGFDFVPGMQSSWSYTGTDHTYLLDYQNEPTMHFSRWRRASDACKRSDVLRAFGQVLGLELEFRHPDFYPGWKTNEDGTIDEAYIRAYWEDELADFITWTELKTMVLDPIDVSARFIAKTDSCDRKSVMWWPFYDNLAQNIPPILYDTDYNTKLSESDKKFIVSIYGPAGPDNYPDEFVPLIEMNYTGTEPSFWIMTSGNLGVKWNADEDEIERFDLPTDTTTRYKTAIYHTYPNAVKRKITIGEMLEPGQERPTTSSAIHIFAFRNAEGVDSIAVKPYNAALETVWIDGGKNFIAQDFDFSGNAYIRNLYLLGTLASTVNLKNCTNLETLATTPSIYGREEFDPGSLGGNGLIIGWPDPFLPWPIRPMSVYSLGNEAGDGVDLTGCTKLNTICLDNTQINKITFPENNTLDSVYISSHKEYIVGGDWPQGRYLLDAIETLPSRKGKTKGTIIVRGVEKELYVTDPEKPAKMREVYGKVRIDQNIYDDIVDALSSKNWEIDWASGVTTIN